MAEEAKEKRTQKVSLDVGDLVEAGYTVEAIRESMNRISQIDSRRLFKETEDIPDMTRQ